MRCVIASENVSIQARFGDKKGEPTVDDLVTVFPTLVTCAVKHYTIHPISALPVKLFGTDAKVQRSQTSPICNAWVGTYFEKL